MLSVSVPKPLAGSKPSKGGGSGAVIRQGRADCVSVNLKRGSGQAFAAPPRQLTSTPQNAWSREKTAPLPTMAA